MLWTDVKNYLGLLNGYIDFFFQLYLPPPYSLSLQGDEWKSFKETLQKYQKNQSGKIKFGIFSVFPQTKASKRLCRENVKSLFCIVIWFHEKSWSICCYFKLGFLFTHSCFKISTSSNCYIMIIVCFVEYLGILCIMNFKIFRQSPIFFIFC